MSVNQCGQPPSDEQIRAEWQAASIETQAWLNQEVMEYCLWKVQQGGQKMSQATMAGIATGLLAQSVALLGGMFDMTPDQVQALSRDLCTILVARTAASKQGPCQCDRCQSKRTAAAAPAEQAEPGNASPEVSESLTV